MAEKFRIKIRNDMKISGLPNVFDTARLIVAVKGIVSETRTSEINGTKTRGMWKIRNESSRRSDVICYSSYNNVTVSRGAGPT